jgi:DNA helicase HerA-like ATPase
MSDILLGKGEHQVSLLARYANRHGLVAGATGTGKTVTLMVMAEGFSRMGVPVFLADVKGDVAGLAMAGTMTDKLKARVDQIGVEGYVPEASPVVFWDLHGKSGHPVRATISEIGPTLLGRMLELNETQTGVLEIVFKLADDQGLLLLDLDDLRALLGYAGEHRNEISTQYGLVSTPSIGAIQRALLSLERDAGTAFFGEPSLELSDLMRTDLSGRGVISVLAADQLILRPKLYSSFLLWLLSELFENLPEVGDLDKPKLVSASTKPTCSSTMPHPRSASESNRSSASFAPRVSACTSAPNSPTTCPTKSSASSATGSSTRSGRIPREIRRRCAWQRKPSLPIPGSTSPR